MSVISSDTGLQRGPADGSGASLPPRRLGLALAVIATVQLMVVLDATIVNVAQAHIQHALGFSGSNLEWVVNAYALAFGGLPIGLVVALAAPRVLPESPRRRGRFDLPGAITGSVGLAALVYGLVNAATTPNGVSHWGDTKVIVSLAAAVVLLVAFGWIEVHSKNALVPMRVLRSWDRSGAYLISLCIGTSLFGMFFFLSLFLQEVWGYSPLKQGAAYMPVVALILVASGVASQLVPRIGARPLMLVGGVLATGGMFWLSRINEHSHYASGLLGPMMVTAAGMGADLRAAVTGRADQGGRQRRGGRLVAAERRPAGRRVDRAGHPGHGGLERGRQQHPLPGRGGERDRASVGSSAGGGDQRHHRPRVLDRLRQGISGLGGDRAARADHHGGRDPGQVGRPGRDKPDGGTHRCTVYRARLTMPVCSSFANPHVEELMTRPRGGDRSGVGGLAAAACASGARPDIASRASPAAWMPGQASPGGGRP